MCLRSSTDHPIVMAGYENGELVSFDLRQNAELASLDLFSGQPLMCFDYSSSNHIGLAGSSENSLKQFIADDQLSSMAVKETISLVNAGINCVKIRQRDSKLVATGGWDAKIRLFGLKKVKPLAVLDFHKDAINTVSFSNENLLVCGSNDTIISFWNIYND